MNRERVREVLERLWWQSINCSFLSGPDTLAQMEKWTQEALAAIEAELNAPEPPQEEGQP